MNRAPVCPRCGRADPDRRFYGPCAGCREELADGARRRHVWHRLLGWLTFGGWNPKEVITPAQWDALVHKQWEAAAALRLRQRRVRR